MMGLEQIAPLVSSLLGLGLEEAEGQTPEGMLGSD